MKWFRMYSEFVDDGKVQTLCEADQRRLVCLFCLKSSGELEKLSEDEIYFKLRITEDEWKASKKRFVSKGFIDNKLQLLNWDKRQYKSDDVAARVKKYREEKKCNDVVTLQNSNGNGSVTPSDTDTDSDTETEKKKKVIKKKAATKVTLPDNFEFTENLKAYAVSKKVIDPTEQFETFKNTALANNYKYADWERAWYKWCTSPYTKREEILDTEEWIPPEER